MHGIIVLNTVGAPLAGAHDASLAGARDAPFARAHDAATRAGASPAPTGAILSARTNHWLQIRV